MEDEKKGGDEAGRSGESKVAMSPEDVHADDDGKEKMENEETPEREQDSKESLETGQVSLSKVL